MALQVERIIRYVWSLFKFVHCSSSGIEFHLCNVYSKSHWKELTFHFWFMFSFNQFRRWFSIYHNNNQSPLIFINMLSMRVLHLHSVSSEISISFDLLFRTVETYKIRYILLYIRFYLENDFSFSFWKSR